MGFWRATTQHWKQRTQKVTRNWRKRRRNGNCINWPRSTTFWWLGMAAKTYMLHRRNLSLKTSRWQRYNIFRILKRSLKHSGNSFNIMVQLHFNCPIDLLCHQLCQQRTSLEDKLKYWMSAESEQSTVIQSNGMSIAHETAFRTLNIGLTGIATWTIQMTVKTIAQQTLILTYSKTMASRIRNAQGSRMWVRR